MVDQRILQTNSMASLTWGLDTMAKESATDKFLRVTNSYPANGTHDNSYKESPTDRFKKVAWNFCLWPISEEEALKAVCKHTGKSRKHIKMYESAQEHWSVYYTWTDPCWFAQMPEDDISRIDGGTLFVIVSKITGKVITECLIDGV